jgi:hypothetical protein
MDSLTAPRYAEVCWQWDCCEPVPEICRHRRTVNERFDLMPSIEIDLTDRSTEGRHLRTDRLSMCEFLAIIYELRF